MSSSSVPASPAVTASPKLSNFRDAARQDIINPPSVFFQPDGESGLTTPLYDCGFLHPYCSLRDSAVDLEGLSRAFYAIRRRAWGRGWRPPTSNDSVQTFMASQLIVLANTGIFDKAKDDVTEIVFEGQAGSLPPGSSSFSFYTEASAVDTTVASPIPQNYALSRAMMGAQLTTLVNIDAATRRPKRMADDVLERLRDASSKSGAAGRVKSLGLTPLGRLPTHEDIISGAETTSKFVYEQSIRCLADFDFNQHTNQAQYFRCALNAIVSLSAHEQLDDKSGPLAQEGVDPKLKKHAWLSAIGRAIRIDYQSEIEDREGDMVATIFQSGSKIPEVGAACIGPEMLRNIAPPAGSGTEQRMAYFTITLKGDASGKIFSRGFIVYDYTAVVVPRKKQPTFEDQEE